MALDSDRSFISDIVRTLLHTEPDIVLKTTLQQRRQIRSSVESQPGQKWTNRAIDKSIDDVIDILQHLSQCRSAIAAASAAVVKSVEQKAAKTATMNILKVLEKAILSGEQWPLSH